MADLSKIKLNNVEYNLKDTQLRNDSRFIPILFVQYYNNLYEDQDLEIYKYDYDSGYGLEDYWTMTELFDKTQGHSFLCWLATYDGDDHYWYPCCGYWEYKSYQWYLHLKTIQNTKEIFSNLGNYHFMTKSTQQWNEQLVLKFVEFINNEETDPIFTASPAANITSTDITNWNNKLSSYTETDPTVPAWAKASTKPSYTASEVGATTTSDVNELIATAIGGINSFDVEIVNALPTTNIKTHTIYFVSKTGSTDDIYDEYMYINNGWEKIGTTDIDLSGYVPSVIERSNETTYISNSNNTGLRLGKNNYSNANPVSTSYIGFSTGISISNYNYGNGDRADIYMTDGFISLETICANSRIRIGTYDTTQDSESNNAHQGISINGIVTPTSDYMAANKAYVDNAISGITHPVTSVNGQTGAVTLTIPTKTSDLTNNSRFLSVSTNYTALAANNGISLYQYSSTTNGGFRKLVLGNQNAHTATDGAYGYIELYGTGASWLGKLLPGDISSNNSLTADRTWTLPNASGTIALTSDVPSVPSWALQTTKPSYTASEVGAAASSHTHGNITSGGDITTTATIASGDRLVINDESESKVNNSSITFGSSTSQYLANNGTWQNIPTGIFAVNFTSGGSGGSMSNTTYYTADKDYDEIIDAYRAGIPVFGITDQRIFLYDQSGFWHISNFDGVYCENLRFDDGATGTYADYLWYWNTVSITPPNPYNATTAPNGYLTMASLPIYDGTVTLTGVATSG